MSRIRIEAAPEVRTYQITVDGYDPVCYRSTSRNKARYKAFLDFRMVSTKSFGEFLAISSVRREVSL